VRALLAITALCWAYIGFALGSIVSWYALEQVLIHPFIATVTLIAACGPAVSGVGYAAKLYEEADTE